MKKLTNKVISLLLALSLVLSSVAVASANVSDVDGHWSEMYIRQMIEDEIMNGYPDGSFKPDNSITMAEMLTMVNRAFGFEMISDEQFDDISDSAWYADQYRIARYAGYMQIGRASCRERV